MPEATPAPLEAVVALNGDEVNAIYNAFDSQPAVGPQAKIVEANIQIKLVQAVEQANQLAALGADQAPESDSPTDIADPGV